MEGGSVPDLLVMVPTRGRPRSASGSDPGISYWTLPGRSVWGN